VGTGRITEKSERNGVKMTCQKQERMTKCHPLQG
jgi:hypothetical protein